MITTHHLTRSAKCLVTAAVTFSLLGSSLGFVPRVEAASLTVTTLEDELNEDGDCSLREAIVAANTDTATDACPAGNGADTIELGAGTYEFTLTGSDENAAATGDLDITDDLTIQGQDAETTIIDANWIDRVIDIRGAITVIFSNITIDKGSAFGSGGGVFNQNGNLTFDHVIISSSEASIGGGIFNASGSLSIQNSEITSNSGGGGDVAGLFNGGNAVIENSRFSGNTAFGGGAIENSGILTIHNTDITSNGSAFDYGGILNRRSAEITISNSIINENGGGSGGGILNEGTVIISDTVIQDNEAGGGASGFKDAIGGGIYNLGTMTVYGSTVSGNRLVAEDPNTGVLFGAGIANYSNLNLINSTVSGNIADDQFGGTTGFGGGVYNDGQLFVNNSTIVDNVGKDRGGGLDNRGTVEIANSILARNRTILSDDEGEGLDNRGTVKAAHSITTHNQTPRSQNSDCLGTLISRGYNLVQDSRGCTLADNAPGDLVDVDAQLGTLEDNGGATPTYALLEGSPAIDAGNPTLPGSSERACQATDQRGVTRPQGAQCDIGAYELTDDAWSFHRLAVLDTFDRTNGPPGENWFGSEGLGGYQIIDQAADVVGGGPSYWQQERFGTAQDAYVIPEQSDSQSKEQDLLLKVQGDQPDWRMGALEILYDARTEQTYVESFIPENGWTRHAIFDVSFTDGDQLGGRALTDGTVEVFRNGVMVGTTPTDAFFAAKDGYIGLWFIGASAAVLEDFGGGTLAQE